MALSLTGITTTQAQYRTDAGDDYRQRFYVKAGAQYAMAIMGTLGFQGTASPSAAPFQAFDSSFSKSSFGGGLWASLQVGYFVTPNFGIEAGVKMAITNKEYSFIYDEPSYAKRSTITRGNRPMLLNPSLVYRIPFDRLNLIGKTGVVIPFHTDLQQSASTTYYDPRPGYTYTYDYEYTVRNRFGLGFSCGLEAEYKIADNIAVSAGLKVVALNIDSKERELTSYKDNGTEKIGELSSAEKMLYYNYDVKSTPTSRQQSPMSISFSHASANLGIGIYF